MNSETPYAFMTEILLMCADTYKKRIKKCRTAFEISGPLMFGEVKTDSSQRLSRWKGKSIDYIVEDFKSHLMNFDMRPHAMASDTSASKRLAQMALIVGTESASIPHIKLCARIKELSRYFNAAHKIAYFLRLPAYKHYVGRIEMREICPPEPVIREVPKDIVKIIKVDAKIGQYDEVTIADLVRKHPNQEHVQEGVQKVTLSCHCELSVALHLFESSLSFPCSVEVGISKGLCWLCQQFLKSLASLRNFRVACTQNQGKIHVDWIMPTASPPKVADVMKDIIEREIIDVREGILARRRGDSFASETRDPLTDKDDKFINISNNASRLVIGTRRTHEWYNRTRDHRCAWEHRRSGKKRFVSLEKSRSFDRRGRWVYIHSMIKSAFVIGAWLNLIGKVLQASEYLTDILHRKKIMLRSPIPVIPDRKILFLFTYHMTYDIVV